MGQPPKDINWKEYSSKPDYDDNTQNNKQLMLDTPFVSKEEFKSHVESLIRR